MMKIIVDCTNKCINKAATGYKDKSRVGETDEVEMKSLFGLLYLLGVFRSGRQNLADFWISDGTGVEIFPITMSLFRFQFLLRCLRFDDRDTREDRRKTDKLAAIRDVFDMFVENCKAHYSLGQFATIDEKLEAFRGRCSFVQYIPSKPAKYGLKIFALADAKVFYTANLEVYVGTQPDGPYKLSNSPADLVERMVSPISRTGRNITIDNWFTSIPLASKLLNDHKLTLVGTIRKNKREIPPEFSQTKNRPICSTMFGFQKDLTLVSYIPKKGKVVNLLSTMHHDDKIDAYTEEKAKPEIITFYNRTKGGVDTVDQLCRTYDVSRNSRRWPLTIFFALMNVAGINAHVVYYENTGDPLRRRLFLKKLALELIQEQLCRRQARSSHLSKEMQLKLKRTTGETSAANPPPAKKPKQARCEECPRNKDRKTRFQCHSCSKYICMEHVVPTCKQCTTSSQQSQE